MVHTDHITPGQEIEKKKKKKKFGVHPLIPLDMPKSRVCGHSDEMRINLGHLVHFHLLLGKSLSANQAQ